MLRVPPRPGRTPDWALEINAAAVNGELRISLTGQTDVRTLAARLRDALAGGGPALDLSLVDLSQDDIDEFEEELGTW